MIRSKKRIFLSLTVMVILAVASHFSPLGTAIAEQFDTFEGDKKDSCEALLCLTSGKRPDECDKPLKKYFSIKKDEWKDTKKARKNFLKMCPDDDESGGQSGLVDVIVDSAGRCEAADLNRNTFTYTQIGYGQNNRTCISNIMPKYCTDYFNHTYTADYELPRYVGTPEKEGYWVEAENYENELQAYNQRQKEIQFQEALRHAYN